ncbi:MAG: peroxiredoxin, partial [Halobacteriota archaeon]
QESYDPPSSHAADLTPNRGENLDQPTRFGVTGTGHDVIGRMPEALVDRRATGGGSAAIVPCR